MTRGDRDRPRYNWSIVSVALSLPLLRPLQRSRPDPGELGEDSGVSVIDRRIRAKARHPPPTT